MTQLVGILNVTPDSFSDGGLYVEAADALKHADDMFAEGAALVDIGAESTAPHAPEIDATEEWQRLEPILPVLLERYPGRLSLDTRHPETAERVLRMGEVIINDMTCMTNPAMIKVVADYGARCIIGHIPGNDVHASHDEDKIDDINQVTDELLERKQRLLVAGLRPDEIILDPGIGFGKTPELNWELLKFAALVPGHKVMVGYSKKRFLGDNRKRLAPNLVAGRVAATSGAAYLRVHDVGGHRQSLD
jgi:dihydropteroate synthase